MLSHPGSSRRLVSVAATFTAEPISDTLDFWFDELNWDCELRFAPYNQVFQTLLDPAGLFAANLTGVNVVLVRLQDLGDDSHAIAENAGRLGEAIAAASRSLPVPLVVAIGAPSPDLRSLAESVEIRLATKLAGVAGVHVVTSTRIAEWYPVADYYDASGDKLGHVPYTPAYYAALGTAVARTMHALAMPPYKVIVLDCDNTLWEGACGDEGPEGVRVDPARRALQQFMKAQHDAGMLLCLCSKNNEEDVIETFRKQTDMVLGLEHCVAWRINWEPKGPNLVSLAAELNLGLDSFIFIDDDAKECGEIEASCPQVLTLPLPHDASEIPRMLRHVWAFDRLAATEEDRQRTSSYMQGIDRRRLERQAATLGEFLAELKLEVRIAPIEPEQFTRVAQLSQRTNQMNFTTIRRTENEIQALLRGGAECLVVDASDRFGSYGLVGVMLFSTVGGAIELDTFLLSCRALGRGIEHRMLANLGRLAVERNLPTVLAPFKPAAKNQLALNLVDNVGAAYREVTLTGLTYRFPASYLAGVTYKPAEPAMPPAAAKAGAKREAASLPLDYGRIARELSRAHKIVERVHSHRIGVAGPAVAVPVSATPLEAQIAAIWTELLGIESAGLTDDFFDLGGHSLLAVRMLSRLHQVLGVELSLDAVYSGPLTVAELAKSVELHRIGAIRPSGYADLLAEVEALTDEEVRELLAKEQGPAA
ncbi:MAG: HAD-IIIC family phosphatase [Bryobacteraceae bacterium]